YVKKLQKEEEMTIISITHDLEETTLSDRVIIMKEGKIVKEGAPQQILSNTQLLRNAYLKEPFVLHLIRLLRAQGLEIPKNMMTEEELVRELCKLKEKA